MLLEQLRQPGPVRAALSAQLSNEQNMRAAAFLETVKKIASVQPSELIANNKNFNNSVRAEETRLQEALEAITHSYITLLLEKEKPVKK